MEQELWMPIKGYEGLYAVSNKGRIKSFNISNYRNRELIMSPILHKTGYEIIGLTKKGKQRLFRLHRLVALHFCKKEDGCNVVNHLNGVKTDNKSENLEWTTVSGNTKHSFKMGLQKPRVGEESTSAILSKKEILEIRSKYEAGGYTHLELSNIFCVSRTNISLIVNRKRWSHI